MLKQITAVLLSFVVLVAPAYAQVEVNKADVVALDGIKGIGPATSKTILAERTKGGNFKDWPDFESRVKGVGGKKAAALSEAGLRVNGEARAAGAAPGAGAGKQRDGKVASAK